MPVWRPHLTQHQSIPLSCGSGNESPNRELARMAPVCSLTVPQHIGVLPPGHRVMVWTACAMKGMWEWSWKYLLCHLSASFLQVKMRDPIHISPDCILTPSDLIAAHTLHPRMKSPEDGRVPASRPEAPTRLGTKFEMDSRGSGNETPNWELARKAAVCTLFPTVPHTLASSHLGTRPRCGQIV